MSTPAFLEPHSQTPCNQGLQYGPSRDVTSLQTIWTTSRRWQDLVLWALVGTTTGLPGKEQGWKAWGILDGL